MFMIGDGLIIITNKTNGRMIRMILKAISKDRGME
jgi:hypothetical protein